MSTPPRYRRSERYAHEQLDGCGAPFGSLPCTLFVLFQVITCEDWHVIMRAIRKASGALGLVYVLTFYLVVNVCILSLMTALTINTFLGAKADLLEQGLIVDSSDGAPAAVSTPPGSPESRLSGRKHSTSSSPTSRSPPFLNRSSSRASSSAGSSAASLSRLRSRRRSSHQDLELGPEDSVEMSAAQRLLQQRLNTSARALPSAGMGGCTSSEDDATQRLLAMSASRSDGASLPDAAQLPAPKPAPRADPLRRSLLLLKSDSGAFMTPTELGELRGDGDAAGDGIAGTRFRIAKRTITTFSRRAAAGLGMHNDDQAFDYEEEMAIAAFTVRDGTTKRNGVLDDESGYRA